MPNQEESFGVFHINKHSKLSKTMHVLSYYNPKNWNQFGWIHSLQLRTLLQQMQQKKDKQQKKRFIDFCNAIEQVEQNTKAPWILLMSNL